MSLSLMLDLELGRKIACEEICWTFVGMEMECGRLECGCMMPGTGDLYIISFFPHIMLKVVFTLNVLDHLSIAGGRRGICLWHPRGRRHCESDSVVLQT